jgi:hypothetical protein
MSASVLIATREMEICQIDSLGDAPFEIFLQSAAPENPLLLIRYGGLQAKRSSFIENRKDGI